MNGNNTNRKFNQEESIMNNKKTYEERTNGVTYVNITKAEYEEIRDKSAKESNLTGFMKYFCKKYDYKLELMPDENNKPAGKVYHFPHYVLKFNFRIAIDNSDEFVDITNILDYPDDCIVFMNKNDLKNEGFREFIVDRIQNILVSINKTKIKRTDNLENYKMYRDLRTIADFYNKYSSDMTDYTMKFNTRITTHMNKVVIFHTIYEEYVRFGILTICDPLIEEESSYPADNMNNDKKPEED